MRKSLDTDHLCNCQKYCENTPGCVAFNKGDKNSKLFNCFLYSDIGTSYRDTPGPDDNYIDNNYKCYHMPAVGSFLSNF